MYRARQLSRILRRRLAALSVHDAQRIAGASPSPVISLLAGLGENPNRAILEHIQWLQDEIVRRQIESEE